MSSTESVDIRNIVQPFGPLEFTRAEWWESDSKFVVLRYSNNGVENNNEGIRMDLDKGAFLDRFGNSPAGADAHLLNFVKPVRQAVYTQRSMVAQKSYP